MTVPTVKSKVLLLLLLELCAAKRGPFMNMFPNEPNLLHDAPESVVGEPLLLSTFVQEGRLSEARAESAVNLLGVKGYTGFITVNTTTNSNMFFWYFPNKQKDVPLVLWLQGGPGGSSMFGLFVENGPYRVDKHGKPELRKVAWTNKFSMLYVDNPVGTGYSFTDKDEGFARSQVDVARDLYSFLQQFYQLFPDNKKVPFYVSGESYAGKYIPAISYKIYLENLRLHTSNYLNGKFKIPLAGMAIGDGFTDPMTMSAAYAPLLYQIGHVDENQRDIIDSMFAQSVKLGRLAKYEESFKIFDMALNGDVWPYPSYFTNCSGTTNYFNYLRTGNPKDTDYYSKFLTSSSTRKLIHVGNRPFHNGSVVERHMLKDFMQGTSRWVEKLLTSGLKTLFYNGNLDIIVGLPLTERLLWQGLDWPGLKEYQAAKRKIQWLKNPDTGVQEPAYYVRKARNLYQVAVRNAGHLAPYDQPESCLDLLEKFVNGTL